MTNDERAQIRATGATSAHVGMSEAEQERARVVAWLRERRWTDLVSMICSFVFGPLGLWFGLTFAADAIERGEHLKGVE